MVRVPGSSGDLGYHRESSQEEAKIKVEPGSIGASTEGVSPSSHLKSEEYTERQSPGRSSGGVKEEGSAMDFEEKPHPPPLGLSGPSADRDASRNPPDEDPSVKTEGPSPKTTTPTPLPSSKKSKKATPKPAKMKLKAPDADESGDAKTWTEDELRVVLYRKKLRAFLIDDPVMKMMKPKLIGDLQGPVIKPAKPVDQAAAISALMRILKEAGIVAGNFNAEELLELDLATLEGSTKHLVKLLTPLVGAVISTADQGLTTTYSSQSGSPHSSFASAKTSARVSEAGSDSSIELSRMTLGPAGAAMLEARKKESDLAPVSTAASSGSLQSFFNAAMDRYQKEQEAAVARAPRIPDLPKNVGTQDVDMESVGSHHDHPEEYDPDDLSIEVPRVNTVSSADATSSAGNSAVPRVRISAISELKEFSGKDFDEEKARSWLSKVKSAFARDQATDSEKCIVFSNLLVGPARNWYQQLGRTTRSKWNDLLGDFRVEYCGLGVSLARQYYHARKRSDEKPLEYLHRLTVLGLRAKLEIKTGPASVKREHVEHFIETLDDRELADQLTLLRITDGDSLAEILRARQRAKVRQSKAVAGSNKFRQKAPSGPPQAASKTTRAVRAIRASYDSAGSGSELESSGSEDDRAPSHVYLAAAADHRKQEAQHPNRWEESKSPVRTDREDGSRLEERPPPCSHCGSARHSDLGCWKRLTCEKCGRRGHPADHCLYVCRACGKLHEDGKCPMEEFYNLIRQWYNPTQHAGMLPPNAEKMLNSSPDSNLAQAACSKFCIFAHVERQPKSTVSEPTTPINSTHGIHESRTATIAGLRYDEYSRSDVVMELDLADGELRGYWKDHQPGTEFERPAPISNARMFSQANSGWDLLPGESRGYWRRHSPGKWFKQAKAAAKINNSMATLLLDSGSEVSIVSASFAHKVGCIIDESQRQDCIGIGENVYATLGRTTIKITLAGSLVYFFDAWVGDMTGQDAILGMDFMIPAGIRLDLADGTMCLPNEMCVQLKGRRPLYGRSSHDVILDESIHVGVGKSVEIPIRRPRTLKREKLWILRGEKWVPTVVNGLGRTQYLKITNISDSKLVLQRLMRLGLWLAEDLVPRIPGLISIGSRRYAEWQNLAYEATTERQEDAEPRTKDAESFVGRPKSDILKGILKREGFVPNSGVSTAAVKWDGLTELKPKPGSGHEPKNVGEESIDAYASKGLPLTSDRGRAVIREDPKFTVCLMRGEITCKVPKVQLLRKQAMGQQKLRSKHEFIQSALSTAHDRARGDISFNLAHGWDPRSTLEAALPIGVTGHRDRDARRWRNHIQEHYQRAREHVNERLPDAIRTRADRHNEGMNPHQIETGSQVWLHLDRVKTGYARKLAHMWHGPFRVAELVGNHAARLEIAGSDYKVYPIVHLSKLKLIRNFPDRPKSRLVDPDADRFDFDEALLPEDSWEASLDDDEYEVDRIADVRSGRMTRYGRVHREFLVNWKGYEEPSWVDEADLNCGALLREFERKRANRNRFNVMQSHEEDEGDPSQ